MNPHFHDLTEDDFPLALCARLRWRTKDGAGDDVDDRVVVDWYYQGWIAAHDTESDERRYVLTDVGRAELCEAAREREAFYELQEAMFPLRRWLGRTHANRGYGPSVPSADTERVLAWQRCGWVAVDFVADDDGEALAHVSLTDAGRTELRKAARERLEASSERDGFCELGERIFPLLHVTGRSYALCGIGPLVPEARGDRVVAWARNGWVSVSVEFYDEGGPKAEVSLTDAGRALLRHSEESAVPEPEMASKAASSADDVAASRFRPSSARRSDGCETAITHIPAYRPPNRHAVRLIADIGWDPAYY